MVEKYTVRAVTHTEIVSEFPKPTAGLKDFPTRIFRLLKKYDDGMIETACCWICVVDLVEFTIITTNGKRLNIERMMQMTRMKAFFNVLLFLLIN